MYLIITKLYTLNVLNGKFYVYFTTDKWIGILKFSVCVVLSLYILLILNCLCLYVSSEFLVGSL